MKISVIVASYMREDVLVSTLHHLLNQDCSGFEVILVDQTSSHSPSVEGRLHEFTKRGQIIWLRAQDWSSLPAARNCGIAFAQGEIIVFVDDDVVPCRDLLSSYLRAFNTRPDAMSVVGRILIPDGSQTEISSIEDGVPKDKDPLGRAVEGEVLSGRGCNMAFRREVFSKHGVRFDPAFLGSAHREESDVFAQMTNKGMKIWFDPDCVLVHLGEETGGCRSSFRKRWREQLSYTASSFANNRYFNSKHLNGFRGIVSYWVQALKMTAVVAKRDWRSTWLVPAAALKAVTTIPLRSAPEGDFKVERVE